MYEDLYSRAARYACGEKCHDGVTLSHKKGADKEARSAPRIALCELQAFADPDKECSAPDT